jgi:hypothetical protein
MKDFCNSSSRINTSEILKSLFKYKPKVLRKTHINTLGHDKTQLLSSISSHCFHPEYMMNNLFTKCLRSRENAGNILVYPSITIALKITCKVNHTFLHINVTSITSDTIKGYLTRL